MLFKIIVRATSKKPGEGSFLERYFWADLDTSRRKMKIATPRNKHENALGEQNRRGPGPSGFAPLKLVGLIPPHYKRELVKHTANQSFHEASEDEIRAWKSSGLGLGLQNGDFRPGKHPTAVPAAPYSIPPVGNHRDSMPHSNFGKNLGPELK